MLGRTDRSLLGIWWWTVDRWLLSAALFLMVIGTLMVMRKPASGHAHLTS